MVARVSRSEVPAYLAKADEFLASARGNLEKGRLNAASFDAVQSIINANDALTARFLGTRASHDHGEALRLHADVVRITGDGAQRRALGEALDMRSAAGYLGGSLSRRDAERLVRLATAIVAWAERKVEG